MITRDNVKNFTIGNSSRLKEDRSLQDASKEGFSKASAGLTTNVKRVLIGLAALIVVILVYKLVKRK